MGKNKYLVLGGFLILVLIILGVSGGLKGILGSSQLAAVIGPINPSYYWQLDNSLAPSTGSGNFPTSGTTQLLSNCGGVGGCLDQVNSTTLTPIAISGAQSAVTVEFLMKTGPRFSTTGLFGTTRDSNQTNNFSAAFVVPDWDGAFTPMLMFQTKNDSGTLDKLYVGTTDPSGSLSNNVLAGINYANLSTYADGNFHHYVFKYSASTGSKSIWVDGYKIAEKTGLATGNITLGNFYFGQSTRISEANNFCDPAGTSGARTCSLNGQYDEVAIYTNQALPDQLIYEHYKNSIGGGSTASTCSGAAAGPAAHYCSATNYAAGDIPATPAMTAALDPQQFEPGYPNTNITTYSAINQLNSFPMPRYKPGNTLWPIFSWADITYFSGRFQPGVSDSQSISNVTPLMTALASKYNFSVSVSWGNDGWSDALADIAVAHPEWKTSLITLHAQLNSFTSNLCSNNQKNSICYQGFANNHYFQNSSGQFLSDAGNAVSAPNKIWRPISTYVNDYGVPDGNSAKSYIESSSIWERFCPGGTCSRTIDIINEDSEVFPFGPGGEVLSFANVLSQDPAIVADKNANYSSLSWYDYLGEMRKLNEVKYRDTMLSSRIFDTNASSSKKTKFTGYLIAGGDAANKYNYSYKTTRDVTTPWATGGNPSQYYSNPDFYVRFPYNWRNWSGPWHGIKWAMESRKQETKLGDNMFMPSVGAGWSRGSDDPTTYSQGTVRPGQWLGFLKLLNAQGAENFLVGYFDEATTRAVPSTYAWQYVMPSYAQAVQSRLESFVRTSSVMTGDSSAPGYSSSSNIMPMSRYSYEPFVKDGYLFATGNPNVATMVRKSNSGNKYMIVSTLQPNNSFTAPLDEHVQNSSANIDGTTVQFESRRQGSTYYYDNSNTAAPVFYQIDGWQEDTHPIYWTKDFDIQAELNDGGTAVPKTEGSGVASRNFTPGMYDTFINPASGTITYNFQPNTTSGSASNTWYLWYRARSNSGAATASIGADSITAKNVSITNTAYAWCNKDVNNQVISFTGITDNASHQLKFTGTSANFYADEFLLTKDASKNLGDCTGSGGSSDTTAPSTPGTLSASGTTGTSTTLTWGASTDNVGIAAYDIYNNGVIFATSTGTGTSFTLSSLTNATTYNFTVKAKDAAGNSSLASNSVAVTTSAAADTTVPVVAITAPVVSGGTYLAQSTTLTTLAGTSSDNVAVTSVTWTNSLGGSGTATGTTNWTVSSIPLTSGANVITVTAKDAANNVATKSITVNRDTTAPTVSVTAPTAGQTFPVGTTTISLTANATDNIAIDHVDFYFNSAQFIGGNTSVSGSNYTRTWTPTVTGATTIYAIAYDTSGNPKTSSTISIQIDAVPPADTTPPTVSMSAPATGSTVSGSVTLGASATDPGTPSTGITSVAFYLDGTAISGAIDTTGGNPNLPATLYEAVWNTSGVTNGTHTISAKATDGAAHTTTSSTISVTVNNVTLVACNDGVDNDGDTLIDYPADPGCTSGTDTDESNAVLTPDVVITDITMSPASPTAGQAITFSAIVKNQGTGPTPAGVVTGVLFTPNSDTSKYMWSDTYTSAIPAGASVTLTANGGAAGTSWIAAAAGSYPIKAEVDDINRYTESNDANNVYTENITVGTAAPGDTTGPTITVVSPANGATVSGTQTISASATDTSNVDGMTISIDGVSKATSATGSVSYSWNTASGYANGTHSIVITASDASTNNNSSTSTLSVSVNNSVSDTTAPTLTITSPANNANVTNTSPTTFYATATDNVAVTQVKFFLGATTTAAKCTLASPTTAPSTYTCAITVPSIFFGLGSSTINVQAFDAAGNVTTKNIKVR